MTSNEVCFNYKYNTSKILWLVCIEGESVKHVLAEPKRPELFQQYICMCSRKTTNIPTVATLFLNPDKHAIDSFLLTYTITNAWISNSV
jgi:hypothetical protein